jgi:MFS family permease
MSASRARTGFWVVAYVFTVVMAFGAVPTPLYAIYERRDGFSALVVTLVFAVYAVGVVVGLFLAGHISDWVGRRRVLLPAVAVEIVAAVVFVLWPSLPGLLVGRVLSGVGIGSVTATATAYLTELHERARPRHSGNRAQLVAIAANLGGIGLGPFVSGILAQFVTSPLRTPYLVFLGLLGLAAVALTLAPETVVRPDPLPTYRPQRVTVPGESLPAYLIACAVGFAGFALLGLFTSLAPQFVAGTLHHTSRALAGAVVLLVFGTAAVVQMLGRHLRVRRQVTSGLALVTVGLVALTAGVWSASLPLFLVGGAVAGAGVGLSFKGAVTAVVGMAVAERRGEALAGFFAAAYLGLIGPVIGLGVATEYLSSRVALLAFAAALAAVTVAVAVQLPRARFAPG